MTATKVFIHLHHHELPTLKAYMETRDFDTERCEFLTEEAAQNPKPTDTVACIFHSKKEMANYKETVDFLVSIGNQCPTTPWAKAEWRGRTTEWFPPKSITAEIDRQWVQIHA